MPKKSKNVCRNISNNISRNCSNDRSEISGKKYAGVNHIFQEYTAILQYCITLKLSAEKDRVNVFRYKEKDIRKADKTCQARHAEGHSKWTQ